MRTPNAELPEVREFMDMHLGMFVHWGLYCVPAGVWKGQALEQWQLGEGIMFYMRIPLAEYREFTAEFRPSPDWAGNLVRSAKEAGMRYIVITAKHHDGFCLFRSQHNDYNAWDQIGRDLIEELAQACRAQDMRLGFYYSHTLDWSEPDALGNRSASGYKTERGNTWDFPDGTAKDYSRFLYGKVFTQVRELLTQYGDVLLMWFDFPHNITPEQSAELYDLVKSIQPRCLVNSRVGHGLGDYYDLGDNQIPTVAMDVPQQSLVTLNDTWGYKQTDSHWKPSEQILDMLARTASCGANLLVNVGPMRDGSLTPETTNILSTMGRWVSENREAVYSTASSPFRTTFDWGHIARKENDLFLYINDAASATVELSGLESDVEQVTAVGSGQAIPFSRQDSPEGIHSVQLQLPASETPLPVYRIHCEEPLRVDERLLQQGEVLNLYPLWSSQQLAEPDGQATVPAVEHNAYDAMNGKRGLALNRVAIAAGWRSSGESLQWDACFTRPGCYRVELLTLPGNHIGEGRCGAVVQVEDQQQIRQIADVPSLEEASRHRVSSTGNDNVRVVLPCGEITVHTPGTHRIRLSRTGPGTDPLPLVCLRFILGNYAGTD